MSFTVADIVVEARELLLDELVPYRYSDDYIVRKANQVLKRMLVVRPDLFITVTTLVTVPGALQSAPAESMRLMDVLTNSEGQVPKEIDQQAMDVMFPRWRAGDAGPTTNWMRAAKDPNRFFVYPASAGGESLVVAYAQTLPNYVAADTVALSDAYFPVVLDGVCWLMESLDAEHVESGRARMFQESYTTALASGLLSRKIADAPDGGVSASK
tara:strand:+ start:7264 stop:7902 length:639 start_codon:yes stop_codon:yes gene_type:complete